MFARNITPIYLNKFCDFRRERYARLSRYFQSRLNKAKFAASPYGVAVGKQGTPRVLPKKLSSTLGATDAPSRPRGGGKKRDYLVFKQRRHYPALFFSTERLRPALVPRIIALTHRTIAFNFNRVFDVALLPASAFRTKEPQVIKLFRKSRLLFRISRPSQLLKCLRVVEHFRRLNKILMKASSHPRFINIVGAFLGVHGREYPSGNANTRGRERRRRSDRRVSADNARVSWSFHQPHLREENTPARRMKHDGGDASGDNISSRDYPADADNVRSMKRRWIRSARVPLIE
ncbi:hypothetical protein PUN28_010552 [Cardiocondyla obscurior]|uniref:Ribosomal protein S4 n=1 Tax=Cardiocondyla obscurior TaxID=286306 RepID=A0AAW2FHY7_9HYME